MKLDCYRRGAGRIHEADCAFWINTTLVVAAGVDTLRAELPIGKSVIAFAAFTLVTLSVRRR